MKITKFLNELESIITAIILFALVFCGFLTVICRYVLHAPMAAFEDIMLLSFVWVIYLGASTAYRKDKFPKLELLVDSFPDIPRFVFTIFSYILSFGCSVLLSYAGVLSCISMIKRTTLTMALKIPYWTMALAVPVCLLIIAIRVVVAMINFISKGPHFKKEETLEDIQE